MCEHTFVRWDNLTIEAQEGTALPGYREPAIVRHFDAPEALDTRFYEVRAKSALNRVPSAPACRSAGPSIPIGAAAMRACIASPLIRPS